MESAFQNMSISSEEMEVLTETAEVTKDSVSGMNEKEMEQHLQLCMKLSAENKINSKNAFGLHLIGLLRRLVKDKKTDLQFASLSLQASSKIYSGRVDALYKETFQFHNHLQTILSGGKKGSPNDNQDTDGEFPEGDGPNERPKTSQKKKFKSYVATEESITLASQVDKSTKPHENFELIKAAFSGSATAKKLLNCLQFENDSCEILCARSSKIHKPKEPVNVAKYTLTKAEKNLLQKTAKLASEWDVARCDDTEMSRNLLHSPNQSLPAGLDGSFLGAACENVALDFGGNSPGRFNMAPDTDFLVENNNSPMPEGNETNGLQILNERFCALDITVGSFVNDISLAVSKDGLINSALLPPQSALRKVLKTAEKNNLRKETATEKKKKEVKPREPFFRGQAIDNSLFMPGKRTVLTEAAIACWDKSETTELGTGFDAFDSELDVNTEAREEILEEFEELPYTVMAASDPSFALKNPFIKRKPLWKLWRESKPVVARKESSPGIFRHVTSMGPQPEQLADSFRNMTIADSFGDGGGNDDIPLDVSIGDEGQVALSDFADDIQLTLVAPPELVKPINVRPQQKAMDFDTQKVKRDMWSAISTRLETSQSITFSDMCVELNKEVQSKEPTDEGISWQFAFVMLLVLANEKVLLLENVDEGMDLLITKDVSEVEV